MKKSNKALSYLIATGVVTLSGLGMKSFMEYFYDYAIRRKSTPYFRIEQDEKSPIMQEALSWFVSCESEDLHLQAFDDVDLSAKIVRNKQSNRWVLIAHGYGANYKEELDVAHRFFDQGYNIFLLNLRGHGQSGGEIVGFGWIDRLDILTCLHYLTAVDQDIKIVLYGLSMGATTMMNVTGEQLPSQVVACVADCGYSSMEGIIKEMLAQKFKLLPKAMHNSFLLGMNQLIKKRCHYSIFDNNCMKQLSKSKTPTLFIHGEQDDVVPFSMVFDNYYACQAMKELYTVNDAKHGLSNLNPRYYTRVFQFINRLF